MSSQVADKKLARLGFAAGDGGAVAAKPLSLRRNFSWTLAGNVVYAACQWGIIVVLARLGNPEMVGRFALAFAVTAPVILFSNLQLRAVQATDARRQYRFGEYLALRLLTTAFALMAIATITFVCRFGKETALVILVLGVAKAFEAVTDVTYGLLQQRERMDRIAHSQMIKGPLSLAAMGIVVFLTGELVWGVLAMASVWVVVLVIYDLPNASRVQDKGDQGIHPRWHLRTLTKLAWLALPLGFVTMLASLGTSIPRYYIEHHVGTHELGIFVAIAYPLIAGNTIFGALALSAVPRLARYYAEGEINALCRLLTKLIGISVGFGVVVISTVYLMGHTILAILYTPEYAQNSEAFLYLAVGLAVRLIAGFLYTSIKSMRHFRILVLAGLLSTAVVLALVKFLVVEFGLQGAVWAVLLSAVFDVSMYLGITLLLLGRRRSAGMVNVAPVQHGCS